MTTGQKIRKLREEMEISLSQFAKNIGVSKSLISKIERDDVTPSLTTLKKICNGLNVQLRDIFEIQGVDDNEVSSKEFDKNDIVVRKDERKTIIIPKSPLKYHLLVPNLQRNIMFTIIEVMPKSKKKWMDVSYKHKGEECILILKGELTLHLGEQVFVLKEGDSASYSSEILHYSENNTDDVVVYVAAISPPSI